MQIDLSDPEVKKVIGRNIAAYRRVRGYSQQWLARNMVGYSRGWVQRIESGDTTLELDEVYRIAELLKVRGNDMAIDWRLLTRSHIL